MARRLILAALCAATAQASLAGAVTYQSTPVEPDVALRAYVMAGTTSSCGMREAAHLIEHLMLSDTSLGESPLDAILALRAKGIKLTALTHSDFTEYNLEGPASEAKTMSDALIEFLGRSSLPRFGFDNEKRVILSELRASKDHISSPTFYERFIAVHAGGVSPCVADDQPFTEYQFPDVQRALSVLYKPENIRIVAQAPVGTFELDSIAAALPHRDFTDTLTSQLGKRTPTHDRSREVVDSLDIIGQDGTVELIFPIAGRSQLPADAAQAMADQARLEVQAHIRAEYALYTARTFVDQSLVGGWLRLEVPSLPSGKAGEIEAIASKAIANIKPEEFSGDPLWQALGKDRAAEPIMSPVTATEPASGSATYPLQWLIDWYQKIEAWVTS